MSFTIVSYDDIGRFREAVEAFLVLEEAQNNLLLSLTTYMSGTPTEKGLPVYLAIFADGHIVGVAVRTGDDRALVCSAMPDDAVPELWQCLEAVSPPVTQLLGPDALVDKILAASGKASTLFMHLGSFSCSTVILPRPAPGRLRIATMNDLDLMCRWNEAFAREAMNSAGGSRDVIESRIRREAHFVWEDGKPVCQTYAAAPTVNGIRITGVYTPKEYRGRGYASNCVAAVTRVLLSEGHKFVFLFTDLKNPTSNGIYQTIGFKHFANSKHVRLL